MKSDTAPKEPKDPETKPWPRLAVVAAQIELERNGKVMNEIVQEAANHLGLNPEEWNVDVRSFTFVRKGA